MNLKETVVPLLVSITVIMGTALVVPVETKQNALAADMSTMTGNMAYAHPLKGQIASIQLGSNGQPEWIQSGIWVLHIVSSEQEQPMANLMARIAMVKPDGTAMHAHTITNFNASEMTQEGNSTKVLKGTATVGMRDGPVPDVPLTIKIFNNVVIGIWIGPDKVDSHFGTGPVYGTLAASSRAMTEGTGGSMMNNQTNTLNLSVKEVDEIYRWSTSEGINPTLKLVANTDNVIKIQNPTDEEHELVIESGRADLATSGDIEAGESGQMTFRPTAAGPLQYHCKYHPETMKGTIEVAGPS